MPRFDAETLRRLRAAREVSIRTEKHPDSAVVIWVVVPDDEVFVRSWRGTRGRWYRDLATGGSASLEFGGRRLSVRAIPTNDAAAIARVSGNSCGSINGVRTPRRWCGPRSCRQRCGSSRAELR